MACKTLVRLLATILFAAAMAFPTSGEAKTEFERWVEGRGALLEGEAKVRAESLLRSLHPCLRSTALRVRVLDSQDVGAFAWPEGDIVVTRALLALLDDDELSAALAHEVGHLLADGHLESAAALIGKPSQHESEAAADEMGLRLLVDGGGQGSAMVRMLAKVQAAQTQGGVASRALARRLALLEAEF